MKRFLKLAVVILALLFVPVLVVVRVMEASNRFDAPGWGYSVYVAIAFSVPAALFIAGAIYLVGKTRRVSVK